MIAPTPLPSPPPPCAEERRLLGMVLELARRGQGRTSPNPMVGALVARDGRIVGTGFHERAGGEHAERRALREAGSAARGGTLVVSLEPCRHQGRTPPCVDEILAAGIRRVVSASIDPNPLVHGRGLETLRAAGVEVPAHDPVFERAGAELNEVFFKFVTTNLPFVALKAGASLDGRIALSSGESRWVTGEEARAEGRALRGRYDAVLVGIGTALADDPSLLTGPAAGGQDPAEGPRRARVLLDSRLRLPLSSRLVATAGETPLIVYTTARAERTREETLAQSGVAVVRAGDSRVDLPMVLADLARRGIASVLVEGGGGVLGSFLREGLADKLHLFVSPRILGGDGSIPAFAGLAHASLEAAPRWTRVQVRAVGPDLLVEGYPRKAA